MSLITIHFDIGCLELFIIFLVALMVFCHECIWRHLENLREKIK